MEHEIVDATFVEVVHQQAVLEGSQSHSNDGLGFTAGEQGRTMGAGQNSRFDGDGANFR